MKRSTRWLVVAVAFAPACQFVEKVAAPPGQPTLVTEMVFNTGAGSQFLRLDRSQGTTTAPVLGAAVTLTFPASGAGCTLVPMVEILGPNGQNSEPGVYRSNVGSCAVQPGDSLLLRIETSQGEIVTGMTRIPGAKTVSLSGANRTLVAPVQHSILFDSLLLDRTRDSMAVVVDPWLARAVQIEAWRTNKLDGDNSATFDINSDTMSATIPANLIDPLAHGGRTVFRAGADYLFTVAVTDTNYFDYLRSGNDPFTARGFINHLSGAIGVFGSVNSATFRIRVVAPQHDPREGVYHLTGTVGNQAWDLNFNLFVDAQSPNGEDFSALVDGTVTGPLGRRRSERRGFDGSLAADGRFDANLLSQELVGVRAPQGTPFKLLAPHNPSGAVDTLTAVQISGPGPTGIPSAR